MSQKQESTISVVKENEQAERHTTPRLFKATRIDMTWGVTELRPMWQVFDYLEKHERGDWYLTPEAAIQKNRKAIAGGGLVQSNWPIDYPDCSIIVATTLPDGDTIITLDIECFAQQMGKLLAENPAAQKRPKGEGTSERPGIRENARLGELHLTPAVLESNSYGFIANCIDNHACRKTGSAPRDLIEYWAAADVRISQWRANSDVPEKDMLVVFTFPGGQSRSMMNWEYEKLVAQHLAGK